MVEFVTVAPGTERCRIDVNICTGVHKVLITYGNVDRVRVQTERLALRVVVCGERVLEVLQRCSVVDGGLAVRSVPEELNEFARLSVKSL